MVKLVFYVLTLAHWMGCCWYFITKVDGFPETEFSPVSKPHMMVCFDHSSSRATNTTSMVRVCKANTNLLSLYVFVFQWGLSALASLGSELAPETTLECMLSILTTMLGFFVTSYIMGQIYSIILNLDIASNQFISLQQDAHNWFQLRRFPEEMQQRITKYLTHDFDTTHGMDEDKLLDGLPR